MQHAGFGEEKILLTPCRGDALSRQGRRHLVQFIWTLNFMPLPRWPEWRPRRGIKKGESHAKMIIGDDTSRHISLSAGM